jgi:hypothetical protein
MHRFRKCAATSFIVTTASAAAAFALACCSRPPPLSDTPRGDLQDAAPAPSPSNATPTTTTTATSTSIEDAGAKAPPYAFDDGNDDDDDADDLPQSPPPAHIKLTRVGTPPNALTRICDLTPFKGALYAAHANQPLGTDGATITRYRIDDDASAGGGNADGGAPKGKFSIAFDWNRPGEPTKGGGAGQGFLRVHKLGGRLFVSDADPPYNGLSLVEYGTEGYVFVSDPNGKFASARMPGYKPPAAPDAAGKAGAGVLPRAYHVIDVARWDGALFASTGSVPPTERAWHGPSPGALHRANESLSRWIYDVDYPFPYENGVWRLTFMTRFHDRLYAGIQDYDGREPNDYVYLTPSAPTPTPTSTSDGGADLPANRARMHAVRVTDSGAAETLRWYVDKKKHRLYWLAWAHDGVHLRATDDGDTWRTIDLPADAGRPTDVKRWNDAIVVLTERALLRLDDDGTTTELVRITDKKTPFEVSDFFCVAPLGFYKGSLYAGGQRGGTLYRFDAAD